jgi:hypothetical protein
MYWRVFHQVQTFLVVHAALLLAEWVFGERIFLHLRRAGKGGTGEIQAHIASRRPEAS